MKEVKSQFYTFGNSHSEKFILQSGEKLGPITLAYETYGELNSKKDNAILLIHALTGSQHAAGLNTHLPEAGEHWREACHVGWWDDFIGDKKPLDTSKHFIICANSLGGCYGTTGPSSINPETGKPYGSTFPQVSMNDIVDVQVKLLDFLGIEKLQSVVGASVGGLIALNLSVRYPNRVDKLVSIASGMRTPILQKIQNFEQIYAIESDRFFNGGDYYQGEYPDKGLALARMIAHKNYISLELISDRARSELIQPVRDGRYYALSNEVESYMLHQGQKFVQRFDANTYIRFMEAWQHFDLLKDTEEKELSAVFERCRDQKILLFSIESDVCFWPEQQSELAQYLKAAKVYYQHITVHSDKGHDAFLLEPTLFGAHLRYFIEQG
jgi:homoserine O-acetyltransferase/O-succinyltransferase